MRDRAAIAAGARREDAEPTLQVRALSLSWEDVPVVADVSFSVRSGQVVCLLGRSGTGKTTLFHGIAGLTRPDAGQVLVEGVDVTGRPGHVSYMLQKDLLLAQHTVLDNVALPLRVAGAAKREARERAAACFPEFGLEGAERRYPSQLSGGMRQRAALLRTYLMGHPVILMDEPFSALDALTRRDMQAWFARMLEGRGLASVLVTHDVDEAIALADVVLVLARRAREGGASTIVGRVEVEAPRAERAAFALTPEALRVKREVIALLDANW